MPTLKENGKRLNGKGSHWINDVVRVAIYLRDHFTCLYCGTDLHEVEPRRVTLDHLVPQCKGGTHDATNLITACLSCNSRRQHQAWRQYAPAGAVERILRHKRRALPMKLARAIKSGEISRAQARLELA